jgi:iron(III) transport system ATP-binding protein
VKGPVRVEARDVNLAFGTNVVLRDIDMVVEPGEFFALLGPSGCGKSTLLRLIAGFNRAQRGAILIDGEDVTGVPPWKRNVGMVFQSYALWPHMTVGENVAFGLEERRLPRAAVREKVARALELVGLTEYAGRRPGQLSGGQQQRVALARTLAIEPRVLLLDEPLSNLDAKLRHHMRRELVAMQKQLAITTIFVTHDQEEAMTTADRIAVMHQGVIQQVGAPTALYDDPVNRFVAEFVGTINLVPGEASAGTVASSLGTVGLPAGSGSRTGRVEIAFRPHSVALSAAPGNASRHWVAATVSEREFLGEFVRYRVRAGDVELIADQPHALGDPGFAPGARVHVGVDPGQLRLIPA